MPNGPTPQAERIEGGTYVESRPLCRREEALCRREEALCRGEEDPVPRGGPLCREEALCAGRYYVLRGLEDVPVSGGGPCAERRSSMPEGFMF